jgi:hypothetical protein
LVKGAFDVNWVKDVGLIDLDRMILSWSAMELFMKRAERRMISVSYKSKRFEKRKSSSTNRIRDPSVLQG